MPSAPTFGVRWLWPLAVLLVALAVRLWGIDWQLPAALYFDEMKYVGWASAAKDDASAAVADLRNPTLFHHLLQAEYALASAVRGEADAQETAVFELWLARVTSAVLGALACVLTALATSALVRVVGGLRVGATWPVDGGRRDAAWAGLAAGLVLALAPLHVHLSHYAVNDAPASLFLAATLLFGSRALAGETRRDLVLAGVAAGLAFSTKYNFAVGLVLPLLAAAVPALTTRPLRGTNIGCATGEDVGAADVRGAARPHGRAVLRAAVPLPTVGEGKITGNVPVAPPLPRTGPWGGGLPRGPMVGWRRGWGVRAAWTVALVLAGYVLGAVVGGPEIVLRPNDVVAGIVEQARLGATRWNGQSDAPVWLLYAETLLQGFGWPALLMAGIGAGLLAWSGRWVLLVMLAVPVIFLAVMLRQELFFARFALPLLLPLAMLAGLGIVGLTRLGLSDALTQSKRGHLLEVVLLLAVLGAVLLPEIQVTVRHNQLATTTDTRVLARQWLRQQGDNVRVATEVYGQPIVWAGNQVARGFRLQRVQSFVEASTVRRLACDGTRYFLVASLTAERELARSDERPAETGYGLLAREGRVVRTFDPYHPEMSAPAHPDNTGIPFWFLEAYARPGPKIAVFELPDDAIDCRG